MADPLVPQGSIPSSISDTDVSCECMETISTRIHRKRRQDRFLKGPIPLSWIRKHVNCATDRLLLVLRAHADMQGTLNVKLTADILRDAGISNRKTAYRAIKKLEVTGSLSAVHKQGRRPILCLKATR